MEKPTICIFSAFYLPHLGGVETFTDNIARALIEKGYRLIVVTSALDGNPRIEKNNELSVVYLPAKLMLNGRFPLPKKNAAFNQMISWLDDQSIDHILINQRFYPLSTFAMKYAKGRGIVPLVMDHGAAHLTVANSLIDPVVRKYEHWITNRGKKFGNNYIAVSKASAEWLKHFGINAVGVVNNSIDVDEFLETASKRDFRKELGLAEDCFMVVFTGRLMKEKGLPQLCEAIKNLNTEGHKDIHLVVAGDGPLDKDLRSYEKDNVHSVGRLAPTDISALLIQSQVFCLPTVSEGFSISMLEAAATHNGLIVTRTGIAEELILDDSYGIILPNTNPQTITNAILKFYSDRDYLEEAANKSAARASEAFPWDKAADALISLFNVSQINRSHSH